MTADADDGAVQNDDWKRIFLLQLDCGLYGAVFNSRRIVQGNCMPLKLDPTRFQPLQPAFKLLPRICSSVTPADAATINATPENSAYPVRILAARRYEPRLSALR